MIKNENLAANFCGVLASQGVTDQANEWRILGQEQDGSILAAWVSFTAVNDKRSNIGIYNPTQKTFDVLYTFQNIENVIQGSINRSRTLLAFVLKDQIEEKFAYKPCMVSISTTKIINGIMLKPKQTKQTLIQFLWTKNSDEQEKFLIMTHEECITLHTCNPIDIFSQLSDNMNIDSWISDQGFIKQEIIVKQFNWAQWDPVIQALYYIHLKQVCRTLLEKEENQSDITLCPTLSAFQFHDALPTETVLNIPLNLPKLPETTSVSDYEDDTIPLRIHDSALNLIIVSDDIGMLFVCHYYLYKPFQPPDEDCKNLVHFAYSVTAIHHGCVIHCVIPGIPWEKAKLMKPTFVLQGDHHLLVFQPNLFMHLLDIGITHEPCCHIVCEPFTKRNITYLVPCLKWGNLSFDAGTLDLLSINITKTHLIEAFRNDSSIFNRLSILHYFLVHSIESDVLAELVSIIMERPLNKDTISLLKEILVAGSYAAVKKAISGDAITLLKLLPLTTICTSKPIESKIAGITIGLSHETLWNTTMMLLSPQQRLSPYCMDMWTRLWEKLNENKEKRRFCANQVSEKLLYSLACYQPEALSRCNTPISPVFGSMGGFSYLDFSIASHRNHSDVLPFLEMETCTASKQEHVISVNLRELSVYLVKHSIKQNTGFRWLKDTYYDKSAAPSHVHAVASQYASSQLDLSRALCVLVCRSTGVDARLETMRGFPLIDQMSASQQYTLFHILERYYLAVESLSFPLPQGFSSFFTYLGYRALEFETFLQYTKRQVFELQIDVLKLIISNIDDKPQGVQRKLALLSIFPRSRSHRLLGNWNHSVSLMLKARDHVSNILSGRQSRGSSQPKKHSGAVNLPAANKISPLDTFLDLLTAKASLNELDFELLIESTIQSMEEM